MQSVHVANLDGSVFAGGKFGAAGSLPGLFHFPIIAIPTYSNRPATGQMSTPSNLEASFVFVGGEPTHPGKVEQSNSAKAPNVRFEQSNGIGLGAYISVRYILLMAHRTYQDLFLPMHTTGRAKVLEECCAPMGGIS
jgi:hypothetical protein